jgi:hypothetical protein
MNFAGGAALSPSLVGRNAHVSRVVALCVPIAGVNRRRIDRRAPIERGRVRIEAPGVITELGADEICASRGQ